MKNAKGQEVRYVLEENMLAYLKETQPPEKAAEFEAFLKRFHEDHKPKAREVPVKDSKGRTVSSVTVVHYCSVDMPIEIDHGSLDRKA